MMNQITSLNGVALRILKPPSSITNGHNITSIAILWRVYHKRDAPTIRP